MKPRKTPIPDSRGQRPSVRELAEYIDLSLADAETLRKLGPVLEPHLPAMVDRFYEYLLANPAAQSIIEDGGYRISRLKMTLMEWARNGTITHAIVHAALFYLQDYLRQARPSLPPHYTIGAFNIVRTYFQDVLEETFADDPTRRTESIRLINRILDIDIALISFSYIAAEVDGISGLRVRPPQG